MHQTQRLFFALDIEAPWPNQWPEGRLMMQRHATFAFLGSLPASTIATLLTQIPPPPFSLSPIGKFDASIALAHAMTWHIQWMHPPLLNYRKELLQWLHAHNLPTETRPWLPHLTVCRGDFHPSVWEAFFKPLPCYASSLQLYESLGHSQYRPIWTHPFQAPFEEIQHTADIGYLVRGRTIQDLYHNAFMALAFKDPSLMNYPSPNTVCQNLDEIIIQLNQAITLLDQESGSFFKAVSFHGQIQTTPNHLLQWEMIVDI